MLTHLIVKYGVTEFVFVDECGVNRYYHRTHGRAKRGVRVHGVKHGKRFKRTNIVGAKWGDKHIAVQTYEHATTAAFFEDWFEFELIPLIPEWSVVIMDNASFHRKKVLRAIAERYGIIVLFLPPYSPDFNPIEKSWANFKRWLRDNSVRFSNLQWASKCYFYD